LGKLAAACQPATLGGNNENAHNKSHCKAGKMDPVDFAASSDVDNSGLIDSLLEGVDEEGQTKMELRKLDVYGKDSFFKQHKDTPQDETTFCSLVVLFPTPHEGGECPSHK
ncbi:hypothetical protein EDC04DRAFT_2580387, partial [Pisolithus marmoratus]